MMIPLSIAEKLRLLASGEQMPVSKLKHSAITDMIAEGIILTRVTGRTKSTLYIADTATFNNYLYNKYSIANLKAYIDTLKNTEATRADLVAVSNSSKTVSKRTFKGFLVNSYMPIACTLNDIPVTIHPPVGSFQFVYDFERFIPERDVVIIGIENVENFRYAAKQQHLFPGIEALFVSRYPQEQSRDLVKWLLSVPNSYLHFGDYDLAGINIYLQEYKKHLKERASFFIPDNIEWLIAKYGDRNLYDRQQLNNAVITDDNLQRLISLIYKHKKGLEQEALLILE